jgi:hypothetical protein
LKPLLPILAWTVAIATLAGAAMELRRQRDSADATEALSAVPRFSIKDIALTQKDYQAIEKKTPVYGSVSLVGSAASISVNAAALSDYAAWRLTLDQVLLDNPGITWRIESLCSGKCPGGEAHQAVLKGKRLTGKVEPRNDSDALPATNARASVSSSAPVSRYATGKDSCFDVAQRV